ncbi:MAG: 50S ribosomal protein L17 [Candidatus Brocadiaceae bacterium]|jgi:large subunit ribosomal protein L17
MRHKKKGRKLSRTPSHRVALRRNMAAALLRHERVITTPAKAKEVRPFVERLITLARRALPYREGDEEDRATYLHHYRLVLSRLQDKEMAQKLFGEGEWRERECLAERYADRPGGYTRIVRLGGSRLGVPLGTTVGEIPEFIYEIDGRERSLKMTGNRLGDNAPQALFELVEREIVPEEEEVAPTVTVSTEPEEEPSEEED